MRRCALQIYLFISNGPEVEFIDLFLLHFTKMSARDFRKPLYVVDYSQMEKKRVPKTIKKHLSSAHKSFFIFGREWS